MKTKITKYPGRSNRTHYRRPYPNAADPQYFMDRLVDGILGIVTVMGALTVLLFFLTL